MTDFREVGCPPHLWSSPKMPILNRVKIIDLNKKVTHKMISSSVRNSWPETKFQNEHLLKTFTCLFIHPSLCQVFQIRNFMFVMFSFLGAPFKASFQLKFCLEFHQITALSFNEKEQLKECFEEPNSVSVKKINRQIINRNGLVITREYSLSCLFPFFL